MHVFMELTLPDFIAQHQYEVLTYRLHFSTWIHSDDNPLRSINLHCSVSVLLYSLCEFKDQVRTVRFTLCSLTPSLTVC